MKKFALIGVLLIFAATANAQKPALFKIKYLPNHSYKSTYNYKLIELASSAADPFLSSTATAEIQTGAANGDKNFPHTITYRIKEMRSMGQDIHFDTTSYYNKPLYGHGDQGGKLYIDSVPRKLNLAAVSASIANSITQFEGNIKFPENALRVGDTFNQENQITVPVIPANNKLTVKTTYKLIAVKDNTAVFETASTTEFNFAAENSADKIVGTGKGQGKLLFNTKKSYPINVANELELTYSRNHVGKDTTMLLPPTRKKIITTINIEISERK